MRKLQATIQGSLRMSEVIKRLAQLGIQASGSASEKFAALFERETTKWRKVVRTASNAPWD